MFKVFLALFIMVSAISNVHGADDTFGERSVMSNSNISDRVSRTGKVCLEGEECAGAAAKSSANGGEVADAAAAPTEPRGAETVYNTYCAACHTTGAAGAPKLGDAAAWSARLEKHGSEEALTASAWGGIGMMPAKGMCMDCSEDEFATTVAYILEQSK